MNSKIGFFKKFLYSFNHKKYILLNKESLGKAFIYGIIVSILLGFFQGVINIGIFNNIENNIVNILNKEQFKFEIKDGILNFYNSPYKYDEGQLIIYIDSKISINNIRQLDSITIHKDNAFILLKDGVCIRSNDYELNFYYKEILLNNILNNTEIINIMNKISNIKYILIPMNIIVIFIQILIYSLLISLIGILFNIFNFNKIKYKDLYKMSIYASTLPIMIAIFIPLSSLSIIFTPLSNLSIITGGMILTLWEIEIRDQKQ